MLQISQSEAVAKSLGLDPAGLPGSESHICLSLAV